MSRPAGRIARVCGRAGAGLILALVLVAGLGSGLGPALAEVTTLPGAVATPAAPNDGVAAGGSGGVHVDDSGTIQRPKVGTTTGGQGSAGQGTTGQGTGGQAGISLGKSSGLPTIGKTKTTTGGLDYAAWDRMAQRSEAALASGDAAPSSMLERLRAQLADWREALLGAQNANAARIATLRQQISALGPAPASGQSEAEEIGRRRTELSDQLVRLQAPGLTAEEAYRRADGLISEIDRVLRERQADALLKLWPSPVNPANWAEGLAALGGLAGSLWSETAHRMGDDTVRRGLANTLPLILAYLVGALAILWRGQRWLLWLFGLLRGPTGARAQRIWEFAASLGMIIVPVLGLAGLGQALVLTGLFGKVGLIVVSNLGQLGLLAMGAIWLGDRAFPEAGPGLGLELSGDDKAQMRWLIAAFGFVLVAAQLHRLLNDQLDLGETASSMLNLPIVLVAGMLLWRMGRLLRQVHAPGGTGAEEGRQNYRYRTINVLSRVTIAIGLIAPLLAAAGYNAAAQALAYPAARSLALIALVVLVHRFLSDVLALVSRKDAEAEGLTPVIIGFALIVLALPIFALNWGARVSDLTELWARFQEGFQLGQTRISPTDFVIFAVIFGIGFTLTRLLQGTLKGSVLPRTSLDQGGQNAIVSGFGYLGIFLSALVAIDSTGIDLSGLAIVAGALSVGIGFGLQTIVSNFVSGVILLIERPVSEGDWIEVGPVSGTVKSISVRSTRIQTFDRSDVIVPNSDLITGRVTNWTRFSLTGRLIVPVAVPFTTESRRVETLLTEIAEAQPMVLLSPPPVVALMGFGPEVMNFEIRVILRDVNFQIEVRSEINHMIAKRFAEEGINFSNAQRDYLAKKAEAPANDAAAAAEQRAQDALLAELMGREVAQRVVAARAAPEDPAETP